MSNFEKTPYHSLIQLDDGLEEKLQLVIKLPGVASVSEFTIRIQPHRFQLHAPGRYFLDLNFDVTVNEMAEELKFVKKRCEVKAVLSVVDGHPAVYQTDQKSKSANTESSTASIRASLHDSFIADAAKLMARQSRGKGASKAKNSRQSQNLHEEQPASSEHTNGMDWGSREEQVAHSEEMDEALQSSEETSFKEMASAHNKFKQQDLETEDRDAWKYRHQQSREEECPSTSSSAEYAATERSFDTRFTNTAVPETGEQERTFSEADKQDMDNSAPASDWRLQSDSQDPNGEISPLGNRGSEPSLHRSPEYGDQEASSRFSRMPRRDEPSHRHSRQRRAGKSNSEKRHSEKNTSPRSPSQAEDEAPSTPHRYRETDDGDAGAGFDDIKHSPSHRFGSEAWFTEWKEKRRHYGTVRFTMAAVLVLLAILALDLLRIGSHVGLRLYRAAPYILPNLMLKFRWTRLHRNFQRALQKSHYARAASGLMALLLVSTLAWYSIKISWALMQLAWFGLWGILGLSVSLSSWLFLSLVWRPTIWTSAASSLLLRYAFFLFGINTATRAANCFWGWPLMVRCSGAGILGLLTIPYCLAATMLNISHISIVLSFAAVYLPAQALSGSYMTCLRLLSLVWTAAYIYFYGNMVPLGRPSAVSEAREVPEGAGGEVVRVLQAVDHYEVLQVPMAVDMELLRKAKRQKALATHPDKLGVAPGANEAFARVTEAFDVLSDDKKRKQYDVELKRRAVAEQMQSETDGTDANQEDDDISSSGISFFCQSCNKHHAGKFVDRPVEKARWCGDCKEYHPAKTGDGWHESSFGVFGNRNKMFVCIDNKILDVTEWSNCVLKPASQKMPVNAHEPQYNFGASTDSHSPASTNRKKAKARRKR